MTRGKRIGNIDGGHALKVDMGFGKLRTDAIYVIRHAPQYSVDDGLGGICARFLAVKLFSRNSFRPKRRLNSFFAQFVSDREWHIGDDIYARQHFFSVLAAA